MLKTKHMSFGVLMGLFLFIFLFSNAALADHTSDHCEQQYGFNSPELDTCLENLANTAPSENTGEVPTLDAPGGSNAELNTGNLDIENNPIYTRLLQIINFLSVGVGIVAAISVAIAGIQYTASRGDPNKTAAAVRRISQVGIAIFLYVFGFAILNWLIPGGVFN